MNLCRFEENLPFIFSFLQRLGFLRQEASLNTKGLRGKRGIVLERFRDFCLWSHLLTFLDDKPLSRGEWAGLQQPLTRLGVSNTQCHSAAIQTCVGNSPRPPPTELRRRSWENWCNMFSSAQSQSCPTLCNPMNCSAPGPPVPSNNPSTSILAHSLIRFVKVWQANLRNCWPFKWTYDSKQTSWWN